MSPTLSMGKQCWRGNLSMASEAINRNTLSPGVRVAEVLVLANVLGREVVISFNDYGVARFCKDDTIDDGFDHDE